MNENQSIKDTLNIIRKALEDDEPSNTQEIKDNILILNSGKVMEVGLIDKVLSNPENPYTKALISAILEPDPNNLYKERKILM